MARITLTKQEREDVQHARELIENLRDRLVGEYEDRSAKWQESDAANEVQILIDAADNAITAIEALETDN